MKPVVGVMQTWSWLVFPSSCINSSPLPPSLGRITEYKLTGHLNSIVISVFAIVILSVIGALFKSNHHSMTGSTDDPKNPAAVAATVFSAVIVYVVCFSLPVSLTPQSHFPIPTALFMSPPTPIKFAKMLMKPLIGLSRRLRFPSLPPLSRQSKRCHNPFVATALTVYRT
jgi:hypothetical protein